MRSAGIICECNPLHAGHLRLVNAAREAGAETVIAVMSGCFVQRGDVAVAEPMARAEILIACGFDAVIELPFPYAAASAEIFGHAGVEILSRLGIREIWFGSECGNIDLLQDTAAIAESAEFQAAYAAAETNAATGTAKSYFDLLASYTKQKGISLASNDILALSYLRAIRALNSSLIPHTIRREGASYRDQTLSDAGFPSATALRHTWKEEGLEQIKHALPAECYRILEREAKEGRAPAELSKLSSAILASLRTASPEELDGLAELGGGLGFRLSALSQECATLDTLLTCAATKKYTDARIRRALLFALCKITWEDLRRPLQYARLMAATDAGCKLLAALRHHSDLPLITRYADIKKLPNAARQLALEEKAWSLYSLSMPQEQIPYEMRKCSALILKAEKEEREFPK